MKPTKERRKFRFGFLEKPLSDLCYKHSLCVAACPWPYIIIPLLITGSLGVGYFYKVDNKSAYEMYTPMDGLGLVERRTIEELFPHLDGTFTPARALSWDGECDLVVSAKDEGDILRPKYRKAVIRLNDYVMSQVSVVVDDMEYSYKNICMRFNRQFCHNNPQIYVFDMMMSEFPPRSTNNLTYPMARNGNRRFYIANTLGEVEVDHLSHQIKSAKAWQLVYQLRWTNGYDRISKAWQLEYQRIMSSYKDDLLDITVIHSQSFDLEIRRNGDNIMPKFILCIAMLLSFANMCSVSVIWDHGTPYIDWARSKPFVATAGLVGAIMGVLTTIGLMAFCGAQYNGVCDAMPFVVLGVRLDNTFLMISAIHHTKRTLPAHERVAEAMSEAAMSITITVLTDILSFAVGIPTDFEAVQLFSIYTVLAMGITYIYQLTFLLGVLVLSVRWEERNAHSVAPCRTTISLEDSDKPLPISTRLFCLGSHIKMPETVKHKLSLRRSTSVRSQTERSKVQYQEGTWISRMIRTHYAPFLMKTYTRIGVGVLYFLYLGISIHGCIHVKQGLEPSRLLPDDSYAKVYAHQIERYFWQQGTQAHITFSNAGDLTDKANRDQIFAIIDRFANSKHGMGRDGVDFWLYEFQNFLKDYNHQSLDMLDKDKFFDTVEYFLSLEEYAQYRNDVHWINNDEYAQYRNDIHGTNETQDRLNMTNDVHWTNNTSGRLKNMTAFRALVGMKNFTTALKQIETVDMFRAIAKEYPYYNISTFQIMWVFVDQYEEVLPNTLQEVYGGIAFMILIAVFLIPSVMSTLWVVIAILSIDAGTVGFMTFWDINLDVISMICIIMSIGFSVDFTAHIAYSFVVIEGKDPVDKTHKALGTLAWPILQGAISTTMGVMALAGGGSYIQVAFFKTVFIVIMLGLVHALVFLPVVLSVFSCKLSTKNFHKLCCLTEPVENSDSCHVKKGCEMHNNDNINSQFKANNDRAVTVYFVAMPVPVNEDRKLDRVDDNSSDNSTIPDDPKG